MSRRHANIIGNFIERNFVFVIIVHISDSTFGAVKIISLRTVNILYIVVNAITDEIVRNAVHHRSYLHADKLALVLLISVEYVHCFSDKLKSFALGLFETRHNMRIVNIRCNCLWNDIEHNSLSILTDVLIGMNLLTVKNIDIARIENNFTVKLVKPYITFLNIANFI